MKEEYKLKLATIKWDFIQDYPKVFKGKAICVEFIDGILYP